MPNYKKILRVLLFPPLPLLIILIPAAAVLLFYALTKDSTEHAVEYAAYFLSAYALSTICARIPQIYRYVKGFKERNRYINRYVNDIRWRVQTALHFALIMNGLYAALQLAAGLHFHSSWYFSLAGYYAMLAVMRWVLLKYVSTSVPGRDMTAEYRRSRFCGIVMLLMNQALTVIVGFIVHQNRGSTHNHIITIAMAVYTFTSTYLAIKNLIKFRKYNSPVLSATKVLSFTSALVSILSLETAMIASFGEDDPIFRRIMTASTGFAVCTVELIMAIILIAHSTKKLKMLRRS